MRVDTLSTHTGPCPFVFASLKRRGPLSNMRACSWLLDVTGADVGSDEGYFTVTVESEGATYFGRVAVTHRRGDGNVDMFGMLWPAAWW